MVPQADKIIIAKTEKDRNPFQRYLRTFFDVAGLVRNLAGHGELIRIMAWRDFTTRFRGSFGGLFWSLFHPLVMMVIYTVVFSLFLKLRFSTDASPFTFSVYLLCGLLPWSAVSEGLQVSKDVIRSNVNFVKRVVFPLEILPLNAALTSSIQQIFGFFLLIPLAWALTGSLYLTLFFVPVIVILQLLLTIGLNWMASSLPSNFWPKAIPLIPLSFVWPQAIRSVNSPVAGYWDCQIGFLDQPSIQKLHLRS